MGVPIPAMESFLRQLLAHLPNRTRTLFRGDSGFFVGEFPRRTRPWDQGQTQWKPKNGKK